MRSPSPSRAVPLNNRTARAVSRVGMCVSILAALLGLLGCVDVDGGAVEVRWDIRDTGGGRVGCPGARSRVGLFTLGLSIVPLAGDGGVAADRCGDADARCRFACDAGEDDVLLGITPFFVPDGEYTLRSVGYDADGAALGPPDGVVTPSPVVRTLNAGEVTDLNVNMIIVNAASE